MTIGKRLKFIRQEKNITVKELSKILNVPERTIGSYERDENIPNGKFLILLLEKLSVNINWFLTGKGAAFNFSETTEYLKNNFNLNNESADKISKLLNNVTMQELIFKLADAKNGDLNAINQIIQTLNGMKIVFS